MISLNRLTRSIKRLIAARDGTAVVEMALVLPMIVGMIIGMTDLGMGAYTEMQVQNAAQAGAEYATRVGYNSVGITAAVTNATSLSGVTANPVPSQSCGCAQGTTVTLFNTVPPCAQVCPSGTVGTYVTVNAQASFTTLFSYPGLSSPMTLTASSVVRIK